MCKGVKANNRTCSVSYKQTTRVPMGVIRGYGDEISLKNILTKISKDLGCQDLNFFMKASESHKE